MFVREHYHYDIRQETPEQTAHALLFSVREFAEGIGLFSGLEEGVTLKMKKRTYSVADKLGVLWASVVIGCDHTSQINTTLGAHESKLAAAFGFERFPDQSQINRVLTRCEPKTVEEVRALHLRLLGQHSKLTDRSLWTVLETGRRVLFVDIDQRALVVAGHHFELAEPSYSGTKRGRRGYQLSAMFVGGEIGEVLDEYLDAGKTPAGARIPDLLIALKKICKKLRIKRSDVVLRMDAQYGTPAIIAQIKALGFGYLLKGISPAHGKVVLGKAGGDVVFDLVRETSDGTRHWLTDLGVREHIGAPLDGSKPKIRARTLAGVRVHWRKAKGSRPGKTTRTRRAAEGTFYEPVATYQYLFTSLSAKDLPLAKALDLYFDRATIERYFCDEQNALGARHIRTHRHAGAAVFEWIVALANNILRWMRATWRQTPLATLGLKRLVKEMLQIPGKVVSEAGVQRVLVSAAHAMAPYLPYWLASLETPFFSSPYAQLILPLRFQ